MKLKTLKDMTEWRFDLVSFKTLKEEAIKWIKALKIEENPTPFTAIMPAPSYEGVIKFLLYFFNITEEELK